MSRKIKGATCPRRMHEPGPWEYAEGLDGFDSRHGDLSCTFCGSLHPDRFMELLAEGAELEPTDKSYKAYITAPGVQTKFYYQHLSPEQRAQFVERLNAKQVKISAPGHLYVLPFFCHPAGELPSK